MSVQIPVYMDNHSTTRVDPAVLEAMAPYFTELYGNASSKHHRFGWDAEAAVEAARKQVAALIGASAEEIIFTSGATESVNLAIKGVAEAYAGKGRHIITVATEHKAVLDCCACLERYGYTVTYLPVDRHGSIAVDDVRAASTASTILVSVMMANNEIGTIARIEEIGVLCREKGILFHSDATQAAGRIPVDVLRQNVDLLSFSAHKMYGPKGVGALYVRDTRPRIRVQALVDGGGHEHGMRSGTLNVPGIVGFGAACEIAGRETPREYQRTSQLRDRLVTGIVAELDGVGVNGHPTDRLPNNANLSFAGIKADKLIMEMKDVAASTGSACSSASPEPSHVLKAIGLSKDELLSSVRFGLGRFTTEQEVDYVIGRVVGTVKVLREKFSQLHTV